MRSEEASDSSGTPMGEDEPVPATNDDINNNNNEAARQRPPLGEYELRIPDLRDLSVKYAPILNGSSIDSRSQYYHSAVSNSAASRTGEDSLSDEGFQSAGEEEDSEPLPETAPTIERMAETYSANPSPASISTNFNRAPIHTMSSHHLIMSGCMDDMDNIDNMDGASSNGSDYFPSLSDTPTRSTHLSQSASNLLSMAPRREAQQHPQPQPPPLRHTALVHNNNSRSSRLVVGSKGKIDFKNDEIKTMTYSRRIALYLMQRYKWYNPNRDKFYTKLPKHEGGIGRSGIDAEAGAGGRVPSLEVAWAYFEHITLPRRYVEDTPMTAQPRALQEEALNPEERLSILARISSTVNLAKEKVIEMAEETLEGGKKLQVAPPGEALFKTKLYSPITTPLNQMGDFGLGVGLYFAMLRAIVVLMVCATLLNIPNFIYYASEEYGGSDRNYGIEWHLRGSAVCTDQEWVPCPMCIEPAGYGMSRSRIATNENGDELIFLLKNLCDGAVWRQGMINFATTVLVMVGMVVISIYLYKKQVDFDEDEQTAQDYSIVILNPPTDAVDPNEWRDFFTENFPQCDGMHVTCCTVGVNNDKLIKTLVKRREILGELEYTQLQGGALEDADLEDMQELVKISEEIENEYGFMRRSWAIIFGGIPAQIKKLNKLNDEIIELVQADCPATSVYITFETEKAQRHVLEKLVVAPYAALRNKTTAVKDPNHLFRGKHVLHVEEASEPSTLRWQELNMTRRDYWIKILMTAIVFGMIVGIYILVKVTYASKFWWSPYLITVSNVVFPIIAKAMTTVERHAIEEDRQVWLYIKIAFFRWVNTALVIEIITPFTSFTAATGGENISLLDSVYSIFFAEIVTSTLIQVFDPVENLKRHFVAPRQHTQERMNLSMRGGSIFLAERYSNMTKILFLSLWYCSIYPLVLVMCAVALFINYYTDRFSLMRSWRPSAKLGIGTSIFVRNVAFPLALVGMSYSARRSWNDFPFDLLCENSTLSPSEYAGTWELNNTTYTMTHDSEIYEICADGWTTDAQDKLVQVFSRYFYAVLGLICVVVALIFGGLLKYFFCAKHDNVGKDQNIPFSETLTSVSAYIPQVQSGAFPYPLLACNVDDIKDSKLFEWKSTSRPYEYYDLTKDAAKLLRRTGKNLDVSKFSKIVYWPRASRRSNL